MLRRGQGEAHRGELQVVGACGLCMRLYCSASSDSLGVNSVGHLPR